MAVLAPQDWHPPRDHTMDTPSPSSANASLPRQRSSPANDHSPSPPAMVQQQPYPYPVQQQQAGWSPPHPQQQFYPAFYQNPHQQPYGMHGHPAHSPQPGMHPQAQYYDPANAQFAQWAYQQMMFNAQQQHAHQMSHVSGQRSRAGSASTAGGEYFPPAQMANYNLFPSGTPPAHPSQLPPNGYPAGQSDHQVQQQPPYAGFHPYRRPNRQGSHHQDAPPPPPPHGPNGGGDWRSSGQPPLAPPIQPPYVRADAAGSSTSVNSNNSGSSRQRTNSTQGSIVGGGGGGGGSQSGHSNHGHGARSPAAAPNGHQARTGSGSSANSQVSNVPPQRPHHRTGSSSSSGSATPRQSVGSSTATTATSSSSSHGSPASASTLRRPSPLSQGTFTAAEKRMSRDDSDLAAMLEPNPGVRSGGLKGRLRRALSLNAGNALNEEDEDEAAGGVVGVGVGAKGKSSARHVPSASVSSPVTLAGDDESTATVQKKKSRSLFNSRLNRSTDNISLSSTMSSASMVIRKLGSIGKLTRRNSLAGITSLFKDKKDKDKDGEGVEPKKEKEKDKKKKKGEKGTPSQASVSHVTAELDSSDWSVTDAQGLSPAAMLARQHTLKTNAEAAARAKAEAEAAAAAAAAAAASSEDPVPTTWEKNTTTRQGENLAGRGSARVNEDGMRGPIVEEDSDSDSDEGHGQQHYSMDGWDDDEDWDGAHDDENDTIRAGLEGSNIDDEEMEPWAINVRRSVERTRQPTRGILKSRPDGQQPAPTTRHRSNSYDSPQGPDVAPLGHLPSQDPAQIDGLAHKHPTPTTSHQSTPFLPPLSFDDSKDITLDSPKEIDPAAAGQHAAAVAAAAAAGDRSSIFNHPNISEPTLSTMFVAQSPSLTHRSATAPAKRLAFATNLSVYDTFPATVYDRRSEPATWSRLTPALAQRIKEELNSYKMEEMEVHASSRVHTQFFV
ncbi:hypothetical protein EIP91_010148 [Steccherinum ochraceum]|uniref:Bud neck involved protein n=1 Tax=Steccherinum ochraceum TaxID=92696 RepID=A0A4R0RW50_9APHY|nr:hypothetical protein EIP91_010148 [Steccherinum ochraceum]